ncbi:hypothetical protein FZI85_25245 [Mycobacterium sp. CBMA293]|uniref:hypothetical protein n=1 Tax=unclassified Mycolicibacterium TaxID=2636767 RepID=UPI0012DDC312|nr:MULTISPECIES: hypothetical protein [unclassified Mycolicibacterium]MUL47621.1 hypothetical protein [Mycolicibacterium sp. CBMA 360]MUL61861.1 hypothetical protein [Mycolicibacterium sp. CBMA 335]MUL68934.1 hypothetical protein [Mycolicibacterium sp. CBMA 311]MUL92849.1 hypothetical protein [Mycolicibacterium sp. CBMA 230]MUM08708.1 hypothetical protein [Mycolicibacterium sp. CBMA 213]
MTAPVQTLGPADPKAPFMAKAYTLVTSLLGLATLASTFNLITTEQANAISNAGTSILGTVGTIVGAIAAFRTHRQVNNGTFDAAPEPVVPPGISTAEQIANAIPTVVQDAADTIAVKTADMEKIKKAAADAFGQVPVVGPVTKVVTGNKNPGWAASGDFTPLAEQVMASVNR